MAKEVKSKKFSFNKEDVNKILVGAAVAAAGAVLTYLSEVIVKTDFGTYTPMVMWVWSVLVNVLRKFLVGK